MTEAWNNHLIARKEIPNASNCRINQIHSLEVPTGDEEYRRLGGSITDPHAFGEDPLAGDVTTTSTTMGA